jgi:predicted nucleotidyltransferase
MFTAEERDRVRQQVLTRAEADSAITGAAFTGSRATSDDDRWSDIDLVLAVQGELSPVLDRWTGWLYAELGARHHWDLPAGPSISGAPSSASRSRSSPPRLRTGAR